VKRESTREGRAQPPCVRASGLDRGPSGGGIHAQGLYRPQPGDYVLAVLLIAACVIGLFHCVGGAPGSRCEAVVYQDGHRTRAFPLTQHRSVSLVGGSIRMTLEVEGGRARMATSTCPRKLCVQRRWISRPHETIICLPARTVVRIESDGERDDVDALTE